ncbi:MAG TPA: hypothetical protein VF172_05395 [Nitrososphaera sp.]
MLCSILYHIAYQFGYMHFDVSIVEISAGLERRRNSMGVNSAAISNDYMPELIIIATLA